MDDVPQPARVPPQGQPDVSHRLGQHHLGRRRDAQPAVPLGQRAANYYSPDFDGLVDEAQTSVDPKRRLELYAKAQRLMLDDGAVLSLHQQMDLYGVNKRANFQALSSEQLVGVWMSLKDAK